MKSNTFGAHIGGGSGKPDSIAGGACCDFGLPTRGWVAGGRGGARWVGETVGNEVLACTGECTGDWTGITW